MLPTGCIPVTWDAALLWVFGNRFYNKNESECNSLYGSTPLALGLVLNQKLYRRLQVEGMVGPFGVREEEPVGELAAQFG